MQLCSQWYLVSFEERLNSCLNRAFAMLAAIKRITAAVTSEPLNVNCHTWSTFQAELFNERWHLRINHRLPLHSLSLVQGWEGMPWSSRRLKRIGSGEWLMTIVCPPFVTPCPIWTNMVRHIQTHFKLFFWPYQPPIPDSLYCNYRMCLTNPCVLLFLFTLIHVVDRLPLADAFLPVLYAL